MTNFSDRSSQYHLKWFTVSLAVVLSFLSISGASAQVLWYNGDNNGANSLISADSTAAAGVSGIVYDDFTVTNSGGWLVNGAFGNFIFKDANTADFESSVTLTGVNWEILSGVSDGNSGTEIASGTSAANVSTSINAHNHTIFDISVSGLSLNLAAGTYWLGLQPVTTDNSLGYLLTTSGANAIGTPAGNDSNAFVTDTYGAHFQSTSGINSNLAAFSLGITAVAIPEPRSCTLALLAGGLLAFCVFVRGKFKLD